MPKLPTNLVKRGRSYYFRQKVAGKTRWLSLGQDVDIAKARLRSLKREGLPSPMTVEDAAKRWLSVYVPNARREADRPLAAQRIRDYLVPKLGHVLLGKLSAEHLRTYRSELERSHLSLQSVRHVLSDCRCILRWCEEAGFLQRAPIPRKWLPRIQEKPPDRLSDDEIEQLVAIEEPYGFLVRFLLLTGLRWGELQRAQTSDVQAGMLVIGRSKSGKVRRVPLPPAILDELRGRVGKISPFSSHGAFNRMVRQLSGVEGFHVHRLRHSYGCRWLEKGGSLAALQEILGHSTIVTTQRYARLGEAHVQEEARRILGRVVANGVAAQESKKA